MELVNNFKKSFLVKSFKVGWKPFFIPFLYDFLFVFVFLLLFILTNGLFTKILVSSGVTQFDLTNLDAFMLRQNDIMQKIQASSNLIFVTFFTFIILAYLINIVINYFKWRSYMKEKFSFKKILKYAFLQLRIDLLNGFILLILVFYLIGIKQYNNLFLQILSYVLFVLVLYLVFVNTIGLKILHFKNRKKIFENIKHHFDLYLFLKFLGILFLVSVFLYLVLLIFLKLWNGYLALFFLLLGLSFIRVSLSVLYQDLLLTKKEKFLKISKK